MEEIRKTLKDTLDELKEEEEGRERRGYR